jgi:hypothetical protein
MSNAKRLVDEELDTAVQLVRSQVHRGAAPPIIERSVRLMVDSMRALSPAYSNLGTSLDGVSYDEAEAIVVVIQERWRKLHYTQSLAKSVCELLVTRMQGNEAAIAALRSEASRIEDTLREIRALLLELDDVVETKMLEAAAEDGIDLPSARTYELTPDSMQRFRTSMLTGL